MRKMLLHHGRLLAVAMLAMGLMFLGGQSRADVDVLDDFEMYMDTDDLRSAWDLVGTGQVALHLECGGPTSPSCPNPWCDGHNSEGPSFDGCQYMRVSYLSGEITVRYVIDPPQDWSDAESMNFFYRGIWDFFNGEASLQLVMRAYGGSVVYSGPVIPAASQCDYFANPDGCPWVEYVADVTGHPVLNAVEVYDIVITPVSGGRIYFDFVDYQTPDVVANEKTTWGAIKSLYK
jgi:hypothetical protein